MKIFIFNILNKNMNYTTIPNLLAMYPDTNIIVEQFIKTYPEVRKKFIRKLYKIVDYLRHLKPKNPSIDSGLSNLDIIVYNTGFVSGIEKDAEDDEIESSLKFVSWKYWLAMKVKYDKSLNELDVIIYCLWEMTFLGGDNGYLKSLEK
jgi:hypothetical protein